MTDKGLSRARIRQARQVLSMIMNAAVENGYIGWNPSPGSASRAGSRSETSTR